MNHPALRLVVPILVIASLAPNVPAQSQSAIPDTDRSIKIEGWNLQSSAHVTETGEDLSTPAYKMKDWHTAVVPGTIVGSLVNDKTVPDPNVGVNLRNLIGKKFNSDIIHSEFAMDLESQFAIPWWYRTAFTVPESFKGKVIWLRFGGINYRADIWINGKQLVDAGTAVGTWRVYEFNITDLVFPGGQNAIAVKVYPPKDTVDLALSFVDWNPGFPDRYMGLFREVSLSTSGPVALRYPGVMSHLDLPDLTRAHLTVVARMVNSTDELQTGTLQGRIEDIQFSQEVSLKPKETRQVVLDPGAFPQLNIQNPRLWWPAQMGTPNLYNLQLRFVINGDTSDSAETRFGIREITSQLDSNDHRLFLINGKKLLIRGGGWTMDLMMRKSKERMEDEFRYVLDMGLNTIRLEGMFETEDFFDLADQKGVLILAGLSCSLWETWPKWQKEQYDVAEQSVRSQILRLRSHPSMLVWLNGSDNPPPPDIEGMYLDIEREYLWPNPVISSASQQPTSMTGKSGVKMTGPYEYVVPEFWSEERDDEADRGGAFGFNTETGPGPAIPPIETLKQVLPKEHLWPIDDWWTFHAGLHDFKDFHVFTNCLNIRYGEATNLDDFLMKSQMMRYEAIRSMYEAYSRNKYTSTGVIVWMLNNGWPSFIWNLYDYDLRSAGGYFGAKNALEALHPMYGYDDRAVWVVSSQYRDAKELKVTAKIYDLNMKERFSRQAVLDAAADSTNKVFTLPELPDLTPVYFLKLTLADASGKSVGSNFYWLTSKPETITHGIVNLDEGLAETFADFRPLSRLQKASVKAATQTTQEHGDVVTHITLQNSGATLAFFIRLNISLCGSAKEILPVIWSDNYISLLPGETRELTATYRASEPEPVRADFAGWNVDHAATGCVSDSR
jgi:exo-1,4-beta-D-glucosaminidase